MGRQYSPDVNQGIFGDFDNGNYAAFEADGTLRLYGNATVYDDLQGLLSAQRLPAANAPTWRTFAYGVGGGVTYEVLGFDVGDIIFINIQTNHQMKLNSVLECHIHFTLPSDDTGKKIKFQVDVIAAGITGDYAVPTGSPFTKEHTLTGIESGAHNYLNICSIPAANTTVSSIYKIKFQRIAASSDEYGAEVYVDFIDFHFIKDKQGSRLETSE